MSCRSQPDGTIESRSAPGFECLFCALAVFVLFLHALFIVWVVFGAFVTRSRPALRGSHVAHLSGAFLKDSSWAVYFDGENWLEQGGCATVPGRISAPLYGQACLP